MTSPEDCPPLDELADDCDTLGWVVDEHGRMRDYATGPDGIPETVVLEDSLNGLRAAHAAGRTERARYHRRSRPVSVVRIAAR